MVSSDQGGTVFLDGTSYGEIQPFAMMNFPKLAAGPHKIRIEKAGYQPLEETVILTPDQKATSDLKLRKLTAADMLPAPPFTKPQQRSVPAPVTAAPQVPPGPSPNITLKTALKAGEQMYAWVPPGTFQMGCSENDTECSEDEKPSHTVTLTHGFWLSQTEVTVSAYQKYYLATGMPLPAGQKSDRYPLVNATWDEAGAYCKWAGGRLPTEAEWEYAARGGMPGARYGALDKVAWYSVNGGAATHTVGAKAANRYGLFDMLGNVSEWVADYYEGGFYPQSPSTDPTGPRTGTGHVLRGGSWIKGPASARVSARDVLDPNNRQALVGFRCVIE